LKTDSPTSTPLPRLIELLRGELHEYGGMLALLDQQQESVMTRAADDVLRSVGAINEQMAIIQKAREQRESCQNEVARLLEPPGGGEFAALIPRLPEKFRGAVAALVRENNELLIRVQQRARQNHLLLSRSVELMQQFINTLIPVAPPTTYNGGGQLQSAGQPAQTLFQAVG